LLNYLSLDFKRLLHYDNTETYTVKS